MNNDGELLVQDVEAIKQQRQEGTKGRKESVKKVKYVKESIVFNEEQEKDWSKHSWCTGTEGRQVNTGKEAGREEKYREETLIIEVSELQLYNEGQRSRMLSGRCTVHEGKVGQLKEDRTEDIENKTANYESIREW